MPKWDLVREILSGGRRVEGRCRVEKRKEDGRAEKQLGV